ncbi:magnesium transporter CorA family protein [Nitratidesulfovibrio sp. HK-II]|uniref:magnesium transporter CorA family protein n=1 Tax=Nitratidesulfovibrio sp. HK-II TaxID=2009266 RepID=UPI000E2FC39F|nr:magnesium transporter CorA family protein [Nitratidesulfovibrio sp. HK-II]GBO96634.1 magnesium and cobalt transport protein CorA [Nitratidesulfovibrio sp. HK-II]
MSASTMNAPIKPPKDASQDVPEGGLRVRTLHLAPDCTIAAVPSGISGETARATAGPGEAEPARPTDTGADGAETPRPAVTGANGTEPANSTDTGANGAEAPRPAVVWQDVATHSRDDLGRFLAPYELPDDVTEACLAPRRYPEVSVFPAGIMVHLPTRHAWEAQHGRYLTVLCLPGRMITLHDEEIPLLDRLVQMIRSGNAPLQASVQALLIFLLDACIDANVHFYMEARSRVEQLAEMLDDTPDAVTPDDILPLKRAITRLSIQFEDQFYCLATLQTLQATALPLTSQREGLRDIMDNQNHLARSQARLEMRLRDLYQFCLLVLQRRTDHRIRVLTVLTAVCMPLTVIAGIYGMNFRHMPELDWDYGYYAALAAMLAVAVGMMWFFQKRGWFR